MGRKQRGFKGLKRRDTRRKNKTGRAFIVIFGFILFLALSLHGLFYIKKKISEEIPPKRLSSSEGRAPYERRPEKKEGIIKEKKPSTSKEQARLPKEKSAIREPEGRIFEKEKPKVVIIVDDLGLNKKPVDELLEMPASLSFAVLPNLPYSQYAAAMAYKKGWDVILHLPMEPMDSSGYTGANAGDGALLVGLPKSEIMAKLEKNLASVPYIKGVSNHMGSKFTENSELMELVLERIKSKGLFFIDSRTSPRTIGFQVAKRLGMKAAERDVFLDEGSHRKDYVRSQIERLIKASKEKGYAIGICHPYPDTIKVLFEVVPEIKKEVDIVPVSGVVN